MNREIDILGVKINKLSKLEALAKVEKLLAKAESNLVVTANSEMLINAYHQQDFRKIINQAELTLADGIGLIWAAKILGFKLPERIAGIDLFKELLKLAARKKQRVYLLGAKPEVVVKAEAEIKAKLPTIKLKSHHGYLTQDLSQKVIAEINAYQTDILFVAMGSPLQEEWLAENLAKLNLALAMGVGGSFDIIAGVKKRAPIIIQRLGLEWFYRLLQEPKRISRVLAIPEFILRVLMAKFSR